MRTIIYVCIIVVLLTVILNILDVYKEGFKTPKNMKKVPGKTVWLLWMQGWNENTPWIVQQVRKSWELLNPTWNIELVSEDNLSDYVHIPYINHPDIDYPAKSDIIRLKLLAEHGGVWADATLLCMIPLDRWIYDAMEPAGFWMYHGRDYGEGPASWFMVSLRQSILASKWNNAADKFWMDKVKRNPNIEYHYFWMDDLFKDLCETDPLFLQEWRKVPYIWCESRGQAHMLATKELDDNEELKNILKYTPPYVVKLTRRGYNEKDPEHVKTNAYAAIHYALKQELAPYPLHEMKQIYPVPKSLSNFVAVAADCNRGEDLKELYKLCHSRDIELLVYDKCNFCKHVPKYMYCRPLKNVGREGHTFLHFVIQHYDNLPVDIIFIPSNLEKHDRLERFKALLDSKETSCEGSIGDQANFELSIYEGKNLKTADIRPFQDWFEKYVGIWNPESSGPCWNGIMRTNKNRLLKHPKSFYINILNELDLYDSLEAGHFVERSMAAIF